ERPSAWARRRPRSSPSSCCRRPSRPSSPACAWRWRRRTSASFPPRSWLRIPGSATCCSSRACSCRRTASSSSSLCSACSATRPTERFASSPRACSRAISRPTPRRRATPRRHHGQEDHLVAGLPAPAAPHSECREGRPVAQPELLAPDATVQVDMVVIDPGLAPAKEGIAVDTIPQPLAGAGYSPAVRVGDYVFVAGQMATDFRTGIPAEAQVNGIFWEGSSIRRQTEFILKNLKLTLEAAGSSMAHVLKAQIWLADINDLPRMEDAWRAAFPQDPPARTVLSAADFGVTGGIIEINLVAVRRDGHTRKEIVSARCPVPIGHASPAV